MMCESDESNHCPATPALSLSSCATTHHYHAEAVRTSPGRAVDWDAQSCPSWNDGVKQTATSSPSGLSKRAVIWPHGSVRAS